ncbi:Nitroreductase [Periconia macrospinosa]|uniref:Nitroreductase n=1 Tax=Periconia macrospinosa TaxID=97972 RepID=A0A2V1E9H1_9PLEO|nr:Nitroreductase [Periconia macrospinosa]
MASTVPFLTAVAARRSVYALAKESPIPNSRIVEIVHEALEHCPSPFNVRSTRAVVIFGEYHSKLWDVAYANTEKNEGEKAIQALGPKIKAFGAAYGSVLFFDDQSVYENVPPRAKAVLLSSPAWEDHSSGMHQFTVWTALETEGLGCNLQHYQAQLEEHVQDTFDVPKNWTFKAQLVFGAPVGAFPEAKPKTGLEESLKVFGA